MILGRKGVNQFAKIHLILEEKFRDDPLPCGNTQNQRKIFCFFPKIAENKREIFFVILNIKSLWLI